MLLMWLHCIKFICILLTVFMAVTRTADSAGVMGEGCQTAVRLYGSTEGYWGGQKNEFYVK